MAFSKIHYFKTFLKLYFFKNLDFLKISLFNDLYYIILFSFFRITHKKKNSYKKIISFYKIYIIFLRQIKFLFLLTSQKIYWKFIQVNLFLPKYVKKFFLKKKVLDCFTFLKANYIFIKFSFLNLFIILDIIKVVFIQLTPFLLVYFFHALIKLYINTHKFTTYLFFRNIWFFTSVYMIFLENFIYSFIGGFIFKNYSYWNITRTVFLISSLYYFYNHNNYKICYIRISNLVYIYFFCKIKYVLSLYNDIKLFLKFFLKANLICKNVFSLGLVPKTRFSKIKIFFIETNLKKNVYSFSKYKLRLYFLLFFFKAKSIKYSFYTKKLIIIIIIQAFLAYFKSIYKKKVLVQQISFIAKKYLLK